MLANTGLMCNLVVECCNTLLSLLMIFYGFKTVHITNLTGKMQMTHALTFDFRI